MRNKQGQNKHTLLFLHVKTTDNHYSVFPLTLNLDSILHFQTTQWWAGVNSFNSERFIFSGVQYFFLSHIFIVFLHQTFSSAAVMVNTAATPASLMKSSTLRGNSSFPVLRTRHRLPKYALEGPYFEGCVFTQVMSDD